MTGINRYLEGSLSASDGLQGYLSTFAQNGTLYGIHNTNAPYPLAPLAGGSGSVSSVSVLAPLPGLSASGNPITTSGTITITGTLTPGGGGTGIGAYTAGDLLYATAAQTLAKLAIGANDRALFSDGTTPYWGTLPASASPVWTSTGTLVHLATSTNNVTVGGATDIARFGVIGDTDEVQLRVRANATQSAYLALFEDSAGNQQINITANGDMTVNEEGNDANFRVETDTNANAFFVDGGNDNVGIGTGTPDSDTILDVVSTTKASRPFPTMDSTQRDAIGTPATASVIYNSTTAQYEWWDGAAWVALGGGGSGTVPLGLKNGLALTRETAAIIDVAIGNIEVNGTLVSTTTITRLNMATNGDWIGGISLESASEFANVFIDDAGNVKLYDKLPNYPRADTASRVANMRVNQSGWNGTGGSGLNATSIVYDADTGEGSVTAGMLLGIYTDSTYETGRGRGSAAAGSVNNASFALITAINTGTDTLTVEAGHNIAINDDDYLIVIEAGALEYANVSGTWWRLIDRMYNNSSSDLDGNQIGHFSTTQFTGADLTTGSASFVAVNAALVGSILSSGVNTTLIFQADVGAPAAARADFTFFVDGLNIGGADGIATAFSSIIVSPQIVWKMRLLPGTHSVQVYWKATGGTATIFTSAAATYAQLSIEDR